jgi:hypothetical protein
VSSHLPLSPAVIAPYIGADPTTADATPFIETDTANGVAMPGGARLFLDYGTEGIDAGYAGPHATLREWLLRQGLTEGKDFVIRPYAGADHNEAAWRARVGDQLDWLLGRN